MADRERRVEEGNTKKFEYLENENIFLHEIEGIIHSFWRAIIWWKNKKWRLQALSQMVILFFIFGGNLTK